MNSNKIIRVKTENSHELKTLFDVLKESLSEVNMQFIRDVDQSTATKKETVKKEIVKKPVKAVKSRKEETGDLEALINKNLNSDTDEEETESETESESETETETESKAETENDGSNVKDTINPGGIRITALDEQQALMIYVKLNSVNFAEYYVRHPNFNVGLDLRELYKFMKGIDKDSVMTISVDKDDDQKIEFHLQNPDKGIDTHYRQKMMDIDSNAKRMPRSSEFDISVTMATQDFRKICSEMSQFSEHIEIICTAKEITFKCLGDQNELVKTFKNGENGNVKFESKKKSIVVQAIYSLKYLLTFGKCVNLCNDVQLYLKNDYPLFIQYTVGTLGKMVVGISPTYNV